MSNDFIEGAELAVDEFDPEDLERKAVAENKAVDDFTDIQRRWLERRRLAYAHVFTEGKREAADIEIVLADLQWFCKMYVPTYDIRDGIHAEELSKRKEGRREVFQRIKEFSSLDSDALMKKYTDATTK